MLRLGEYERFRQQFATVPGRPRIAGISGGRTSALMAALLDEQATLCFQNTGKEHAETYVFLAKLEEALERPITWLEFRKPAKKGARPCEARFEIVNFRTANRTGKPFEDMLETLAEFRATKDKGPIAPWWRSRVCTVYMKTRLQRAWTQEMGFTTWDECVGLRADEPSRVAKLQVGVPRVIKRMAPLSDAGINKADVDRFWKSQDFDLAIEPFEGNCTGCFLKDQSDLSRAMAASPVDLRWWAKQEARWPQFGGKNFYGYKALAAEAPIRAQIEQRLRAAEAPENDGSVTPERFKLVVVQERKRLAGQLAAFSCSCEGADTMAELDEDEEADYIANLPEED
jgi:3'-phosphoadenosine 5'-phosphosulfate sulfotransferase (PAPS reductase)/FAD synthetase